MTRASVDTDRLVRFVYEEARILDEGRLDEWYALFTDDARYWMPLIRCQPDGENHTSLFYEDKLLLKVRIERLKSPRSFSQHPRSYCQHVLQHPSVDAIDVERGVWVLRTPFIYLESRMDEQLLLAGVSWLHLVLQDNNLRIRLKKVEILNCDAALPSLQLFP